MTRQPLRVKQICFSALTMTSFLVAHGVAQAHTLWINPMPRNDMDGYKPIRTPGFVLPCGVARSAGQPTTILKSGATQMVQWKETTPHDGCFLIEFAKSDTDSFRLITVEPHPAAIVPNHSYAKMIQLPDMECTGCILRVRQYMVASKPCPPPNLQDMDGNLYYSCANITLQKSGAGDASAPGAPDGGAGSGGSGGTGGGSGTAGGSGGAATGGSGGGGSGAGGSGGATAGTGGTGGSSGSGVGGATGGSGGTPASGGGGGGCAVGGSTSRPGGGVCLLIALFLMRVRRRSLDRS